jgi:hypothetical protein
MAPKPSSDRVAGRFRCKTILYRRRLPFGHFDCKRRVLLYGQGRLVEGVAVADFIGRKGLLQQPPDEFAALPRGDGALEPPDQVLREPHQQL